jgi:hypothetical protein
MWIDSDYGYYGRCVCLSHDAATRGWVRVGIELAPRQSYRVCIGVFFLSVCCGIGACASLARGRQVGKAHTLGTTLAKTRNGTIYQETLGTTTPPLCPAPSQPDGVGYSP